MFVWKTVSGTLSTLNVVFTPLRHWVHEFWEFGHIQNDKSRRVLHTRKNSLVDPPSSVPYCMSVCLDKSSADSIGVNMRSTVRKAARLAVYDEIMMSVKNHHALPTILPDSDLKRSVNQPSVSLLSDGQSTRRAMSRCETRCNRSSNIHITSHTFDHPRALKMNALTAADAI